LYEAERYRACPRRTWLGCPSYWPTALDHPGCVLVGVDATCNGARSERVLLTRPRRWASKRAGFRLRRDTSERHPLRPTGSTCGPSCTTHWAMLSRVQLASADVLNIHLVVAGGLDQHAHMVDDGHKAHAMIARLQRCPQENAFTLVEFEGRPAQIVLVISARSCSCVLGRCHLRGSPSWQAFGVPLCVIESLSWTSDRLVSIASSSAEVRRTMDGYARPGPG
jgi:hypothetical protein